MHARSWNVLLGAAALLAGCIGTIGDPSGGDRAGPSQDGPGAPDAAAATPADVPVARLTNAAYVSTLTDLFPKLTIAAPSLPDDTVLDGFDNVSAAQTPSAALIEAYRNEARAIAALVEADPSKVLPCTVASSNDEVTCGHAFVGDFGARAYRRPLTSDEAARLTALFDDARASHGFAQAVAMVVEAALQTPQFLYRVEVGAASDKPGHPKLTGYELASRLSYFLWNSMPDRALFDAAAAGRLDTAEGIEAEARRLLKDPRARSAVARFHAEWLRFDKMANLQKSSTLFPSFTAKTADSLVASSKQYVDHLFWDVGTLPALLTDTNAYVNADIAPIYGVHAPSGDALTLVPVDPAQRSGVLTQAGLMAAFAHETSDSPVLRGVFILRSLLCAAPPPPPPGVNTSPPMATDGGAMTTRDEFATMHEQGPCATCHHRIDGVGFGFEHYDAVGAWRTTDNGLPVDASGWLAATDVDGPFNGAIELGQRMAKSRQVQACVAAHWMAYALGLNATDVPPSDADPLVTAFGAANLDLRELVVAVVKSDAFRYLGL